MPTSANQPVHHVIVAGFGVVGRVVAELFEDAGQQITVLDKNITTAERQGKLNRKVISGDVCDPQTLIEAGIEHAQALVLAIPDEDEVVRACEVARKLNSDIYIAARTNFVSKGMRAKVAGANCVIVEEVVTAEAMKRQVMEEFLGDPGD